jgi:hypothetical protein
LVFAGPEAGRAVAIELQLIDGEILRTKSVAVDHGSIPEIKQAGDASSIQSHFSQSKRRQAFSALMHHGTAALLAVGIALHADRAVL